MLQRRNLESFQACQRGAVTIEFVMTIPLFLAALAFAFEFGRFFLAHQSTVNNVRSAARYLSRVEITDANFDCAKYIVRTGRMDFGDGVCAAPDEGDYPDYLAPANADIAIARNAQRIFIRTDVRFPLTIFGFVDGSGRSNLRFAVQEDVRWVGM